MRQSLCNPDWHQILYEVKGNWSSDSSTSTYGMLESQTFSSMSISRSKISKKLFQGLLSLVGYMKKFGFSIWCKCVLSNILSRADFALCKLCWVKCKNVIMWHSYKQMFHLFNFVVVKWKLFTAVLKKSWAIL